MPEDTSPHRHSEPNETRSALLLQLTALELEMEQTRDLLRKQSRKRLELYSKLNSLSPIDQLPAEIKTEIFYNALLNDRPDEVAGITPFFLGKICQGWRDFVWSSPILWTNLRLCLTTDKCEAQTNLLRDWLSRATKYPLSFHITTVNSRDAWLSDPPVELLTVLASISAQWKEVDFFLPNTQDCFDAISVAENCLPLLTTATVRFVSSERQFNAFSTAPQLSVLHLYSPYLYKVNAPWHQLREFYSEACTVDEIRGFLNKAPNLIRCSFKDTDSIILVVSSDLNIFDQLPVLQHLEYLELCFNLVDLEATQILGSAKLPALREVCLRGPFPESPGILPLIMIPFQSSRLLEKFTFGGRVTSDHDLIQVLENAPSIKDLCLDFYDQDPDDELLTQELLQKLYPPQTDILLPNLRSFTYVGPTSLNKQLHLFRDFLVYRFRRCAVQLAELDSEQRAVCQIQVVTVTSSSEFIISLDIQEELDSLVQEGLELSLTSQAFLLDSSSSSGSDQTEE